MNKKKLKRLFLEFIVSIILVSSLIVIIFTPIGENGKVKSIANKFLDALYEGNYIQASKYVDLSRINTHEIQSLCSLTKHYKRDATFFGHFNPSEKTFVTGFKPINYDNDHLNDQMLEFRIGKVNGKWKVINFTKSIY